MSNPARLTGGRGALRLDARRGRPYAGRSFPPERCAIARISLALFGGFHAQRAPGQRLDFTTRKSQALFAFLALSAGQPHLRDRLTALLWGETAERQARHSLRQALLEIRRGLGASAGMLLTDGETVTIAPGQLDVDVVTFERLARTTIVDEMERAADLYRGDLLEGLNVPETGFDQWIVIERERMRELALDVMRRLLSRHEADRQDDLAIRAALRLLALDPLQEPVHRLLMRIYMRNHRRAAALRQYQLCVSALRRELGLEPDAETKQIYRSLLAQKTAADAPARARVARAPHVADAPLVGRADAMAKLVAVLERSWRHGARVAIVRGAAGIGKSRLLGELAAEAERRGGQIIAGHSHETERILPFRPWIDALRAGEILGGQVGTLPPAVRLRLSRVFPELGEPVSDTSATAEDRGQLFEALAGLITAAAARQPLLIVLDDLHWSDEMSVRFLSFAGRRLGAAPVLILGAVREEDSAETPLLSLAIDELNAGGRLDEITLGPLTAEETTRLVRALGRLRPPHDESVSRQAWALSGGNPFVVVEVMRMLQDAPDAAGDIALPPSVRDAIARRLGKLSPAAQHLVAVAAAIGQAFPFSLLERAAGLSERETSASVEELIRRRVFDAVDGRFDFDHARIRDVARERLIASPALHAAVAAALESVHGGALEVVADRLAWHYAEAGVHDKAATYLELFAERARQGYALEDALRALDQARQHVERLPPGDRERRRIEILVGMGWILSVLGRFKEILDLLSPCEGEVARLCEPGLAGRFHFRLGITHAYLGQLDLAAASASRALAEAERCDDRTTMGLAHYVFSMRAYWIGEVREGVEHARRAVAFLESADGFRGWLGLAYWSLGQNLINGGDFEEALEAELQVAVIADAFGEPRLRSFASVSLGRIHAARGDAALGVEACRRGLAASRDPVATAIALTFLGFAFVESGEAGEAVQVLGQAIDDLARFRLRHTQALALTFRGRAHLLAGDRVAARRDLADALAITRAIGARWAIAHARYALAGVAMAEGSVEEAERLAAAAQEMSTALGARFEAARADLLLGELMLARGRGAAMEHIARARRVFDELRVPRYAARAERLGSRSAS